MPPEHPPGVPPWARHLPPGAAPADVDLLAEGSLVRAWAARWAHDPGRPVLHTAAHGWWRAGDLERASRTFAGRLHAAGLRAGDRILLSAPSSAELVAAHVGALRLGLVVVPSNTAYTARELGHVVADARPRAAVVEDPTRAAWVSRAAPGAVVTGPEVDLPDGPATVPGLDEADADDPALILYTSGTTGEPKGALLSHGNALASAAALRIAWRWSPDDRLVLALPLFHAHGLCVGLHGTLLAGASAVLHTGFDPQRVVADARGHAASLFFGVPTMYARLAELLPNELSALAALRLCVSGSAPLAPSLFERIEQVTGQRILERYGMSETLMNVSNPYDGERRPGTVGFPLPHVETRVDPGGELLLRGPNVFAGYWGRPEATAAAFDDGWFRTGDLAGTDADGYLSIVGRTKELIITGGFNVYPREVEEVLLALPDVAEVAVTGAPSDEWGEVVTAYVVPARPGVDPSALLAAVAPQLAPYKRPRAVHLVDSLPRNALGKVIRHELSPPG